MLMVVLPSLYSTEGSPWKPLEKDVADWQSAVTNLTWFMV